jgi:hypothetical protein
LSIDPDYLRKYNEEAASEGHQQLVRGMMQYLIDDGWKLTHAAGVFAYDTPPQVRDHIPDLRATKKGMVAYGEVETCKTLGAEDTVRQIDEFSEPSTTPTGGQIHLFIAVPETCFAQLGELIRSRFPDRPNITVLQQRTASDS